MPIRQWLESAAQDIRYGLRGMLRSRASTAVAVATLAVGIGVNATVFTVTNAVLFKGFAGVHRNDRLLYISNGGCCVAYADFEDYRAQARSFEGMAIVHGVGFVYSDSNDFVENVQSNENSADVFRVVGQRPILGRDFSAADEVDGAPLVGILNYDFWAHHYGKDPSVIGRLRVWEAKTPQPWITVVGVVSNIVQNDMNRQRIDPVVYLPYRQQPGGGAWILVRTRDAATPPTNAIRREVRALDADLPMYGPMPIADRMDRFWDTRFYGSLFLIFAAMALLLAAVGLYTVVAHAVGQRTQEIGVRMAVGADARDVLVLVSRQGLLPSAIGLVIGLAASGLVNRLLASELVQVSPSDPLSLAVASAALIGSAVLGCLIPARRAMRVDPIVALRHE
jgi:ABC-type antimicrobial peptide transport system permease subunit